MLAGQSILSQGEDVGKSKFTQEFETSAMQAALREVQASCSEETYEVVKQYLVNSRIKEAESLEKMSAKLLEERDELASQILMYGMGYVDLSWRKRIWRRSWRDIRKLLRGSRNRRKISGRNWTIYTRRKIMFSSSSRRLLSSRKSTWS